MYVSCIRCFGKIYCLRGSYEKVCDQAAIVKIQAPHNSLYVTQQTELSVVQWCLVCGVSRCILARFFLSATFFCCPHLDYVCVQSSEIISNIFLALVMDLLWGPLLISL